MRHLISSPRHIALGLVCAAVFSAWSAHAQGMRAQGGDKTLSRALSTSSQPAAVTAPSQGLRSADYIVAVVNAEPVTNNEVRARMQRVLQAMQAQGAKQIPPRDELAREVLERLIVEKAQVQTAKETGIKADDYAVDQAIQNMAQQNGLSPEAMRREMAQQGISEKSFREEIRNQLLMQRLQNREVDGRVKVSEHDIDQYMAEQRRQNGQTDMASATINLGHILIAVPERASQAEVAQLQARAQQALEAARTEPDLQPLPNAFQTAGKPF